MTINKSDIVICQHFHQDGSSKVRPILVVKKLNDYEFYGYPITSKDHRNDFRARCILLLDWQKEGLYKTSFVTIKFNDKWQKRKYNLSQVAGDGPIGRLSDTDMRRLNRLIQNTTQEDKARLTESLNLNAIYKDDQRTFGFLSEITYADAVYVLKSGKILDTKGPFENQQHENIALYNNDRYGLNDLDENNGSKLMNQANAIRVTPWLKALYLPRRPISEEQCQALRNWISKLKLSKDNPLMISTLDGSDYFEVNTKVPAREIVDIIKDYYVTGHLSENLREALDNHHIIAYHGSKYRFNSFDVGKNNTGTNDGGMFGPGLYFTESPELAKSWNKQGYLYKVELSFDHPYICNSEEDREKLADIISSSYKDNHNSNDMKTFFNKGYDSIISNNESWDTGDGISENHSQYVAFKNNQIKIIGVQKYNEELTETLIEDYQQTLSINDSVVIINTNDVFEGLHGDVLSIVDDTVTVEIVDFPSNNGQKRITQMFDIDNVMKE